MNYLRLQFANAVIWNEEIWDAWSSIEATMLQVQAFVRLRYCAWKASSISVLTYLTIVASVAIYDIMLTIRYAESLKQMEENPIGRWLMNLDDLKNNAMPNLALFLSLKGMGTVVVLITIYTLVRRLSRLGHPIATGVSFFQIGLAIYLTQGCND
jgi:hypothetical protein